MDNDGCFNNWGVEDGFVVGVYILCFYCKFYFVEMYGKSFYLYIDIIFEFDENGGYYYVLFLIFLFGFSSYRGS